MAEDTTTIEENIDGAEKSSRSYRAKPYIAAAVRKKQKAAEKAKKANALAAKAARIINSVAAKEPGEPNTPSSPKEHHTKTVMIVHRDATGNIVSDGEVPDIVAQRYKERIEPLLLQLTVMANSGKTNDELAEFLGMSRPCFDSYRQRFPALEATLNMSRKNSVESVVNSMFMLANGYSYMERKVTKGKKDKDGNETEVVEEWTKFKHPESTAGIFILTNRDPATWKRSVDPNVLAQTLSLTVGSANISETVMKNMLTKFDKDLFGAGLPQDATDAEIVEEQSLPPAPEPQEPQETDDAAQDGDDAEGDW